MHSIQSTKLAKLDLFSKNNIFVYLTSLYIIVWYLQIGTRSSFLGAIRFEFILGAFLALSALFKQLQSSTATTSLTKCVYLFLFLMIIQVPLSASIEHSYNIFIDRAFKYSLLAVFIATFIRSPSALKLFITAFLFACLRLGYEGFLGWYTGGLVWQNQGIMRLHGSVPMLGHPNSFSGFGVGLLPFIYYLFPQVNKPYKLLLGLLLIFSIVIIVFTGSRTGYVASVGFVAYAVYTSKYRTKAAVSFTLLLIISIPFIPEQYLERFESIYAGKEHEGNSKKTRMTILEDALEISLRHPFGVGVGAFPIVREQYFDRKQDTHNLYFEILTNLGVQGLVVFIVLIIQMFKTIKRNQLSLQKNYAVLSRIPPDKIVFETTTVDKLINHIEFSVALGKAVSAFIIVRLFLGIFGMDLYEIYWWLAIGLILAIKSISESINLVVTYLLRVELLTHKENVAM
ncbi:O-antigen ligase family protein [Alkalimarinus coralli]|uniref:O-antigen ligase family protein n=1 Tax=Alkalimarinus coralli TaxID=2935863 RepID=UPI00202B3FD8|nr:O-antigen ligase family protein [Alkalimarinus coralli]